MPNGGSDCCATCWFNAKNKGETGYKHADDPDPNFCTIRNLAIERAYWTYCTNHPKHRPNRDPIPIGAVFVHVDVGDGRIEWQPSPDTEEIRQHLLELVRAIEEQPADEYPTAGTHMYCDEMVVRQLGQFREGRAAGELRRILSFSPEASAGQYGRTRATLVAEANAALAKLGEAAD